MDYGIHYDYFEAVLKLFNGVPVPLKERNHDMDFSKSLRKTISHGFILDPNITNIDKYILNIIIDTVGINGKHLNASFHKSWKKVKYSSDQELFVDQIIHYITTYGFERLGCYDKDKVYIPNEALEVPNITGNFPLIVIKGMTQDEVIDGIYKLGSGIALNANTIDRIMAIIDNMNTIIDIDEIKNLELKIRLCDYYNVYPTDPVDYLRLVIYRLTGETLIIKNSHLINRIKSSDQSRLLDEMLEKSPDNLASIFFRYKPLFLAMKYISRNRTFFNHLRKKANKQHKPLPVDYFNNITNLIYNNKFDVKEFEKRLKNISIYRKTRLAYALNYRCHDNESIVYKIRNGSSWATSFDKNDDYSKTKMKSVLHFLLMDIANSITENVEGKKIYIPDYMNYSLPSTEKSFIGNIPSNSFIKLDKDILIGVHWFNQQGQRIDLDLSLMGHSKIGWDGQYKSDNNRVMFSGDMTDAGGPNGASELFYIKQTEEEPWTINLNHYTFGYSSEEAIPFKFFIGNKKLQRIDKNYMIDPNDVVFQTDMEIGDYQKVLGILIKKNNDDMVFCFSNFSSGNSISVRNDDTTKHIRNYLISNAVYNFIDMRKILLQAKAILVDSKEHCDIDLSPESLDKNSFIDLFN